MAIFAFVLLIAALLMFLASTRQWALYLRGAVWGGGLLFLLMAWLLLGSSARDPELGIAIGDFFGKLGRPGESMLLRMLESNGATVAHFVLSLFDVFLFLAVVVSILALIAFRPGEEMEKALRPVMMGVIGAIVGGLLALALVGTGFGEREKRKAYAGPVLLETVHNGETLLLNGDLLHLRGIDAPEPEQVCRLGNRTQDCGAESARALRRIVEGAYLMCALDESAGADNPTPGYRVATCTGVRPNGDEFNIARRMVEEGFAMNASGAYEQEAMEARALTRGLLTWCSIEPNAWTRLTQAQKTAFRERGVYPAGTPIMGTCPRPREPRPSVELTGPVSAPD